MSSPLGFIRVESMLLFLGLILYCRKTSKSDGDLPREKINK